MKEIGVCVRCKEPLSHGKLLRVLKGGEAWYFCSEICVSLHYSERVLSEIRAYCKKKGSCKNLPLGKKGAKE